MSCPDCSHPAHAGRCWRQILRDGSVGYPCPCTRKAASAEALKALVGDALERDSDLAMDLAKDESDGGLGVTELP